jgi:hypothetical protein
MGAIIFGGTRSTDTIGRLPKVSRVCPKNALSLSAFVPNLNGWTESQIGFAHRP